MKRDPTGFVIPGRSAGANPESLPENKLEIPTSTLSRRRGMTE
jgi:hypothetical protein